LEAPEVERGNRYSALRMTAKGGHFRKSTLTVARSALPSKTDIVSWIS
jgi:hypothetical protein